MSKNYENQILDAIQTLVDNAVDKAKYDKTIKGIVSKCTDQSKGEYVIKYQDSSFYAYSNDLEQIYNSGTPVYVLIPGNDMAQTKTIIGSVNKLGSDYITIRDNANDYQIVGNSVVSSNNEFGVCSYTPNGDAVVLYDKVNSISLIDINIFAANAYLKQSGQLIVGGQFRTVLDNEQKYKGNYGLGFKLAFTDPTTGEDVSRTYLVDINSMTGSPYNYTNGSEQKVIFDIDGENFKEIELITLFCYDFPNTTSDSKPDDIFVSNIMLCGANALSEDEKGGNALTLITPQGIYFDNNDLSTASREITAELRIDNRLITANSDVLQYYWFRENPKINSSSEKYNRYGGNGWECLNSFNNLGNNDADEPIIDWLSAQATYTTTKANNSAKETDYKCVVVYNKELVLSKVLTIFNYSSAYTINITSDSGMYFSYNNGKPTLTATINGSAPSTYEYKWSVIDNNNRFTPIEETTDINTPYHTAQNRYDEIKEGLADGSILLTADIQTELSTLMYDLHQYEKTMRVEDNVIYNLNLSTVTNFSIFSCAVYDSNDVYLGKGKIEIVNDINAGPNAYTLVVNNGDQVFKYNEQGVSPTSKSLENPQEIYPLSFTLYDENGLEINNDLISANDVSWTVPTTDTMINVSDVHGNPSEIDTLNETKTYTGYKELYFTIPVLFSANKTRNTVELKVKYKNKIVIIKKELTFIKEGEVGTNGTNFVCKVLPNVVGTTEIPKYVIYRYNNTTSTGSLNYTPGGEGLWFKAYLYKDGVEIFNGTVSGLSTENKSVTVKWEILVNKYDSTHSDASNFAVNNGLFSFVTANKDIDNPANIARCVLTYEGQTYYATMPIIYVNAAAAYKAEPIENTGFQYAMYTTDGVRPIYDNSNPFALKITQTVNNEDIDISIATEAPYALDDYDWNAEGQVYVGTEWVPQTNLIRRTVTLTDLAKNEAKFYPIEKFDGFCVNNGLVCQISRNSTNLLKIHLPIHLYLNRYGNSALNGWDGNHIEINDDGGFILAPQIGAGKKEQDNSYTGVFMGSVREAGSNAEEVGLFGYKNGVRTIELNAKDGSAKFGRAGDGQILISPDETSAHSVIKSGGYTPPVLDANGNIVTPGQGLEIDLTDPHITFGTGNFRVDRNGQVAATGFVTTSKLESGDYSIPGVENWKTIYATDVAQFEVSAEHYPPENAEKTITCQCSYKNVKTNAYTATLVNSSGTAIANPSTIDGVKIQVSKTASSNDTNIKFSVSQSAQIPNASNIFYVKFTHTASQLSVIKAFYANLIILGADGQQGEQGPVGPAGADGKDGTSVTVKGSYDTLSQLIAAHPSGNTLGDGYVVGLDLYVYTNAAGGGGSQTGDWNDVGQFKGEDGKDAKRCFIVASSEVFKSTDNGTTYIPSSTTISPYLQSVTFSAWAYSTDGGNTYTSLSGTLPSGITINNTTKVITLTNNSAVFNNADTVTFKCTTSDNNVYDILTVTRVKDGAPGSNGTDGINTATVYLYTRNATAAQSKPYSSAVTYTFATHALSSIPTNWSTSVPTGTTPLYVSSAVAASNTATDSIAVADWTTPAKMVQDGTDGTNGKSVEVNTTTITYCNSSSGTTHPEDSETWTSNPNPVAGEYTWTKIITTYKFSGTTTSAGSSTTYNVSYTGLKGDPGDPGVSPYISYLTNETQSLVYGTAQTITTYLYAYQGITEKTVQIKTINGKTATTTDTATGLTGVNFKVSSISAVNHPLITFTTTTSLPQTTSNRIPIVYRVTGENSDRTIYFAYSTTTKGTNGTTARTYEITTSTSQIVKKVDDTFSPNSITVNAYYRSGTSTTKTSYSGRWLIQTTIDGSTWTTAYTSSGNEASKTYSITGDPKLIRIYLGPSGSAPTEANALDVQTIPILNDSTDVVIGGRNYVLNSEEEVSPSLNQTNLCTNQILCEPSEEWVISFDIKGASAYTNKNIALIELFTNYGDTTRANYTWITGSATTTFTRLVYNYTIPSGYHGFRIGYRSSDSVVNTFRKIKVEKGNIVTDWTAAPEDTEIDITETRDIANQAFSQAQATLITYTITDTSNEPAASASWANVLPSAPDKYIWQRTEYRFLDPSRNYNSQASCIYTPTRVTNELEYCLCPTKVYADPTPGSAFDWRSEPFPWKDDYADATTPDNITINKYQFVRNKYTDTNKTENAVNCTTPILDESWYMFGLKLASEAASRKLLAQNINNEIVTVDGQDGVTIKNASNPSYGIRLTSLGMQFLLSGKWETVWNINGTLNAKLIDVIDLKAENILSGTLTLNSADNGGQFIFTNGGSESSRIDENGLKITVTESTSEWEATGTTVEIKSKSSGGISAKTNSNEEYFKVIPKTQETTMTNAKVDNTLGLGQNIKVVQITNGIAFVGIVSGS